MDPTNSYDDRRAAAYVAHHQKNARTRLTTQRERSVLRRCLGYGDPGEAIADLACGAGRFWPTIAEFTDTIVALDLSPALLAESRAYDDPRYLRICGSVFSLPFARESFDTLVCLRFLHHLGHASDRVAVLTEWHRVARRRVIVSLWTDGSVAAARRLRRQVRTPAAPGFGSRRCTPMRVLARDCQAAGWSVRASYRVWPGLSMWRFVVLEKR